MKQPFLIAAIVGILILAGGGAYFFLQKGPADTSQPSEQPEAVNQPPAVSGPGYTIEQVPVEPAKDVRPDLDRPIQFGESIPEDIRAIIQSKVDIVVARLKADPSLGGEWLELGLLYHTANDYEGAREVWEFLTRVLPDNTTAYDNLGKLYHFSLPDFPKSESYFRQAIGIDPDLINPYLDLFELYRYSYKTETSAGADILKEAMRQFPDRLDLWLTLGTYYAERGNTSAARSVLTEGLDKARDAGNVDMIATFGGELARLPAQ